MKTISFTSSLDAHHFSKITKMLSLGSFVFPSYLRGSLHYHVLLPQNTTENLLLKRVQYITNTSYLKKKRKRRRGEEDLEIGDPETLGKRGEEKTVREEERKGGRKRIKVR